jgi:GNAT superfamily N-acetyltransferase
VTGHHAAGGPRAVGPHEVDTVVDVMVGAFYDDPLWSWAFPDPLARRDQQRHLWDLVVDGAARYPWVWLDSGVSAASVWIPPEGTEFSDDVTERFEPLLHELLGSDAPRVLETLELLEHAHPRSEPHFYLSLLGTRPDRRGHGFGLTLLAENLRTIDGIRAPAYLEASNTANVALYERHGFEVLSSFQAPHHGPEVVTMWRPAAPGS